ncbi:MAG: hypothetical protein J7599_16445 [Niabella sp.]|nr:hypothetical protein [Niabella sp.]
MKKRTFNTIMAMIMSLVFFVACNENGNSKKTNQDDTYKELLAFLKRPGITDCDVVIVNGATTGIRRNDLNKEKKKLLDSNSGGYERDEIIWNEYQKSNQLADELQTLILDAGGGKNVTGMRIYFASEHNKPMKYIFTPTRAGHSPKDPADDYDATNGSKYFYIYENTGKNIGLKPISVALAKQLVHGYQDPINGKRGALRKTLPNNEQETKHVWFSKKKLECLIAYIKSNTQKAGVKMRLISYPKDASEYAGHMSVDFVFVDSNGQEIGIKIPKKASDVQASVIKLMEKDEHSLIMSSLLTFYNNNKDASKSKLQFLQILVNNSEFNFLTDDAESMDTGSPTPPPPADNEEGLDIGPN